jgi:hypothetical protein
MYQLKELKKTPHACINLLTVMGNVFFFSSRLPLHKRSPEQEQKSLSNQGTSGNPLPKPEYPSERLDLTYNGTVESKLFKRIFFLIQFSWTKLAVLQIRCKMNSADLMAVFLDSVYDKLTF